MTVHELVAALAALEPEAEVVLQDSWLVVNEVREVAVHDGDDLKRMADSWGPVLHPHYKLSLSRGAQTVVVLE